MKRTRLALAVLIVAVLALAGVITVSVHNGDAAADAVREYVDAIARGDGAAANAAVDPKGFADGVDPELLTSTLEGARERISVREVALSPSAERGADVVPVQVTYTLDGADTTVELRARRAGATIGVLHDWAVVDPLLVPVRIGTNEPRLDTATLGETTVPVGGTVETGFPDRRFFVYPGIYDLTGADSAYLSTAETQITATVPGYDTRPTNDDDQLTEVVMYYEETPELTATVNERLAAHVTACVAAPATPRPDCPDVVYRTGITDFVVDLMPIADQMTVALDDPAEPSLLYTVDGGELSYTASDGTRFTTSFTLYCTLTVAPGDRLTVTFSRTP